MTQDPKFTISISPYKLFDSFEVYPHNSYSCRTLKKKRRHEIWQKFRVHSGSLGMFIFSSLRIRAPRPSKVRRCVLRVYTARLIDLMHVTLNWISVTKEIASRHAHARGDFSTRALKSAPRKIAPLYPPAKTKVRKESGSPKSTRTVHWHASIVHKHANAVKNPLQSATRTNRLINLYLSLQDARVY